MKTFLAITIVLLSINNNGQAQVYKQDSLALVDFYNSTHGANWSYKPWVLTNPVSTWAGVTTGSFNKIIRVTRLSVPAENLVGHLPTSIGNLTKLTYLDVTFNQLNGKIPSSIGKLIHLTYMSLSGNKLSDSIPSSIGNLVNLQILILGGDGEGGNKLTGAIPSSFGNLTKLTTLALGSNRLSGTIPTALGNLTNLIYLYLDENNLQGTLPSSLGSLAHLNTLRIEFNQLHGPIPASLASLPALHNFQLSENYFNFDGLEAIAANYPDDDLAYAPQNSILLHLNNGMFSVSAGGTLSKDTFHLFKNGQLIHTQTGDSVFNAQGAGSYFITVTNSICSQLTLYTDTLTINAGIALGTMQQQNQSKQ